MSLSDKRAIELADELAWHLFNTESDAGELKKSLEYYRLTWSRAKFIQMLRVRSSNPQLFQRSDKTRTYYQEMSREVGKILNRSELKSEDDALRILGWAFRLMQFYNTEKPSLPLTEPSSRVRPDTQVGHLPTGRKTGRLDGTVKWFDASKRFGFITPDGGGEDVFVHISQTPGEQGLQEHQRVSFVMGTGPKGRPQAQDVQPE